MRREWKTVLKFWFNQLHIFYLHICDVSRLHFVVSSFLSLFFLIVLWMRNAAACASTVCETWDGARAKDNENRISFWCYSRDKVFANLVSLWLLLLVCLFDALIWQFKLYNKVIIIVFKLMKVCVSDRSSSSSSSTEMNAMMMNEI